MILIRSMKKKKKMLSKDNQRKSANEIKKCSTLVVVRHNLDFKDLTKFGSEIHEDDTSLFKLLFS